MAEKIRKRLTTTIDENLLKEIKILAIKLDKSLNDLLEEGIEMILKKHSKDKN